jgi:hypothetical protein
MLALITAVYMATITMLGIRSTKMFNRIERRWVSPPIVQGTNLG